MASRWGQLAERVKDAAEERLGVTLVDRLELGKLRESYDDFIDFRQDAAEMAYWTYDYFGGRPQEMRRERRERLAQRSRIALTEDPLAGAQADLLANFSFGKGVGMPQAEEPDVQDCIEEAWTDPVNEQKLTEVGAQRYRSNQLITGANLYPTAYVRNGRVRLGFLNPDRVKDVICDPEDEERPLWYVYDEPPQAEYDFKNDRWKIRGEGTQKDQWGERLRYYAHWRNVEDVRRERLKNGQAALDEPPKDKQGAGVVEHIRINRIGVSQFGTPPWARVLRFFTAMNQLTEAHVAMAQAASSFIAKRVIQGTPETITRAAGAILSQTGELGASRFGGGDEDVTAADEPRRGRAQAPPDPGAFWLENESDSLENLGLNSGAAQALQSSQIVRAPISAATQFGQHYLGDPSSTTLSGGATLELPTLMNFQAWQETFAQMFRWFTDMVIQEAVRAGRLGGESSLPELDKPLTELGIREAEEKAEAENRTGKKLGYKFKMPYPGRRNLPDVTALVTGIKSNFDANGQNVPLQRALLLFAATHGLEEDDPAAWVDDVLPEEAGDAIAAHAAAGALAAQGIGPDGQPLPVDPATGHPMPPGSDPTQIVSPEDKSMPKRARQSGVTKDPVAAALAEVEEETARLFSEEVVEPLLAGASSNGDGDD